MKHIFLLSGDYINLAKEEVLSLFYLKNSVFIGRILIADLKNEKEIKALSKRLALTKSIYKLLFECKINELENSMKNVDWNSVYEDNFCLRVHNLNNKKEENGSHSLTIAPRQTLPSFRTRSIKQNLFKYLSVEKEKTKLGSHSLAIAAYSGSAVLSEQSNASERSELAHRSLGSNSLSNGMNLPPPASKFSEKNLAAYVWKKLKSPKVNLENPKTKIEIFIADGRAYCGLLVFENKENFEARQSHLRPFPHPSSLHPKVARALVNISEIKNNETLLDPFCGAGGFLIEAGLMSIKSIGYDINKIMIDGCIKNLKHYKIRNCKIKKQNALEINDDFDYAVTDLPYGLNSNVMIKYENDWKKFRINKKIETKNFTKNLERFYLKFLENLRKKLKKKAIIVFPNYVDYRKLLKKSKFKVEKKFSNYVHRSLTRKIVKISQYI